MIREEDVYPPGTVVRIKKTNEFAVIRKVHRFIDGSYQHYLAFVEGKEGLYVVYHQDIELEALP